MKQKQKTSSHEQETNSPNLFSETVSALVEATGFDKQTSEVVVLKFCEQSSLLIREIKRLFSYNNYQEVSNRLHLLKGSAGNIRAITLWKQAIEAENTLKGRDYQKLGFLLEEIEETLKNLICDSWEGRGDNGK